MWKKFPLTQDCDSKKIVGQVAIDEKIIEEIERETPDFIRVHDAGIPLKLGYSGVLKKGSFTIKDFNIEK